MPRVPSLVAPLIAVAALLASLPAAAQSASDRAAPSRSAGLRMLSWPGKVERPVQNLRGPVEVSVAPAVVPDAAPRPAVQPVARPVYGAIATPAPSHGLTPASAWLRPAPTAYTAAPTAYAAAPVAAVVAPPAPAREVPPEARPAPRPSPAAAPVPTAAPPAADPMAPRRDAAIFRLQSPAAAAGAAAPVPAAPASQPSAQGARYYSVHRAAGREPDPTTLPEPFFLDAAPVDLAEPPAQPTLMRNADGRVRAAPLADEPTLP